MTDIIEVGTPVKIRIPYPSTEDAGIAECPWGLVVGVKAPGRILARIDNHLICSDMHGYQFNDVVELEQFWLDPTCEPIWHVIGMVQQADDPESEDQDEVQDEDQD